MIYYFLFGLYGLVSIFIIYLFYTIEWKRYLYIRKKHISTTATLIKVVDDDDAEHRNFILTLKFMTEDGMTIESEYYERPAIPLIKSKYQTAEQYFLEHKRLPIIYHPDYAEWYVVAENFSEVRKRAIKMLAIATALIVGIFLYGSLLIGYINAH